MGVVFAELTLTEFLSKDISTSGLLRSKTMKNIEVQALSELLDNGEKITLLDIREQNEVDYCKIPGALHIPMNTIPHRLDELDSEGKIVIYCHTGVRSMHVCHFLEQQGFQNVLNLRGGIHQWSLQVDPSVPTY
jgi:rhodanese-related sulfurtransferase